MGGRVSVEFRERTKTFALAIVRLFSELPKSREEVRVLGRQLLRSGTSVSAQTREAARARSDSEFCSKLEGALQEADESQLWLELLREGCSIESPAIEHLHRETGELIAIIITIVNKTKANSKTRQS